jgi:hypothetical protein
MTRGDNRSVTCDTTSPYKQTDVQGTLMGKELSSQPASASVAWAIHPVTLIHLKSHQRGSESCATILKNSAVKLPVPLFLSLFIK